MPPVRTFPTVKPVKTERTHEENQERAYIAASRRSDRSLEARVESARRASEIHKRRTGRSLRVTEQDVVNEEMYEEEDDDLPMQYRRLTAHLQTTNADFDRRLAAYLTNHVAMRAALGQAVSDQYVHQQYPNAPQFANQMQQQFPQSPYSNSMMPPQMMSRSPQNFRQSPYPMPNHQAYRPNNMHSRASPITTTQEPQAYPQSSSASHSPVASYKSEDRRTSLPAQAVPLTPQPLVASPGHVSPSVSRTSSSSNLANLKHEAKQQGYVKPAVQTNQQDINQPQHIRPSTFPTPFSMGPGFDPSMGTAGMMSFSTSLPMESQQLLGPMFDPNDPFTSMFMNNQEVRASQPFYSYNPNGASKSKGQSPPPNHDGMNQTLAPGVLDANSNEYAAYNTPHSSTDSAFTPYNGFGGFGYDTSYVEGFKGYSNSALNTPGEHDWSNLLDANVWEEPSSQPTAV